jgi:hypothetical protein
MVKSKPKSRKPIYQHAERERLALAMDFDEVMRRVVRVKPEKSKNLAKRKRK